MKANKIYWIGLMTLLIAFTACEKKEPFDSQKEDDAPIILRPYNESGSGSFNYSRNSDEPLVDSVVVTPSAYTTVNWYVDGELVFTGKKINMYFPIGKYSLRIEAVTTAGKKTFRDGSLTVNAIATDPYSAPSASGRYAVPNQPLTLYGQNLSQVQVVMLCKSVKYDAPALYTMTPTAQADDELTFSLPEMEDGKYYLRFKDAEGKEYGCDAVHVTRQALVISGYDQFIPTEEWTITGFNLQNVASVKIGEEVINELTVSETSVTFIAPAMELGEYTLSMSNKDGSAVLFQTADGLVEQVTTTAQDKIITEIILWEGPVSIKWDAERVKVTSEQMADIPEGTTIYVHFEKLPENDPDYYEGDEYKYYHALRITTPWWDGYDLVAQMDMGDATSPFSFTYDADCKNKVETCGAMSLVGWGLNITKITYK